MKRTALIVIFIALFIFLRVASASCEQLPRSFELYLELGKKALQQNDYERAKVYFRQAHLVYPASSVPVEYLAIIDKKMAENPPAKSPVPSSEEMLPATEGEEYEWRGTARETLREEKQTRQQKKETSSGEQTKNAVLNVPPTDNDHQEQLIRLDDELWAMQPNMLLTLELGQSVVLEGDRIERFLIVTEGFIRVERLGPNQIRINGDLRGSTFLHVWDSRGRWTFNVDVIFPLRLTKGSEKIGEEIVQEGYKPFRFSYTNNFSQFYEGEQLGKMTRRSLIFSQWLTLAGETPYGFADTWVSFYKFDEGIKASNYSVGLNKGHWGPFNDFSIRGFDAYKRFSDFSLPGRYFRGIVFDSYAFHRRMKYTLLRSQDRAAFYNITPGVIEDRESYIEGGQIILLPDNPNRMSFNYARGYGGERPSELKERVYSIETVNKTRKWDINSELGFDEEDFAKRLRTVKRSKYSEFDWAFRDIDKNFTTITGSPPGRGEIGSLFNYNWARAGRSFTSYLDLYQDREQRNPDKSEYVNYDLGLGYGQPLSPTLRSDSSLYYSASPQIISERSSLRLNETLTKNIKAIPQHEIALSLGGSFQQNRYDLTPSSDFDRYGLLAGLRMPIIRSMYYFLNYEYSWVNDVTNEEWSMPAALTTGLTYSKKLTERLSSDWGLNYRNEENTEGEFSFLAGEDSLGGNMNLDYRINESSNVYFDGRLRKVWAEDADSNSFNDAEIRMGYQSGWDLPFYWNPLGAVKGIIFFDANRNETFDKGEKGIPNVAVNVGKKNVITNKRGEYFTRIRAKKVKVAADLKTFPQGAFLTTPAAFDIDIEKYKISERNFGLSTQTGIYGVVYFDDNQNGKLNASDKFIPNVILRLDNRNEAKTDANGGYNFFDIPPGNHTLTLDINSIPIEYIPLVKLKNQMDVKEGKTVVFNVPLRKK
jgi:hypothetical protein